MFITIDRIEELYNSDIKFKESIDTRLGGNDSKFLILSKSIEDCLLHYNESFNISNFKEYFFESFNKLDDSEFKFFVKNAFRNKYKSIDIIYNRIVGGIHTNISEKYDIDIEFTKKDKIELEEEAESLFQNGDISKLFKVRRFLSENFKITGFNSFIRENKNMALKVLADTKTSSSAKKFIRLEQLLKDNPGYLGVFTFFLYKSMISYERIKSMYERILRNKNIIHRLPKNIIEYRKFEELEDDINDIEREQVARNMASEYPRLKNIRDNKEFIAIANELNSAFIKDPKFMFAYRKIFLPKVSLCKTEKDILDGLKKFLRTSSDVDDFVSKIEQYPADVRVVHDGENFLVTRFLDYSPLSYSCGDTNWCIARDLDYWVSYHGDGSTFMAIIDKNKDRFDIYSKIGVTHNTDGSFKTAHIKNDQYISESDLNRILYADGIDLDSLWVIAVDLGTNSHYDTQEDRYGNITGVERND